MAIGWHTEDLGDHRERQRPGERGHQVNRPGGRQRIEKRVHARHDPLPVPFNAARREQAREVRANNAMPLRRKPGQEPRHRLEHQVGGRRNGRLPEPGVVQHAAHELVPTPGTSDERSTAIGSVRPRSLNNPSINARSAASTSLSCPDATMSRSLPRTSTHPGKPCAPYVLNSA